MSRFEWREPNTILWPIQAARPCGPRRPLASERHRQGCVAVRLASLPGKRVPDQPLSIAGGRPYIRSPTGGSRLEESDGQHAAFRPGDRQDQGPGGGDARQDRAVGERVGDARQGRQVHRLGRFRHRERPHRGRRQAAEGDGGEHCRPHHRARGRHQRVRHRVREHEELHRLGERGRRLLRAGQAAHAHGPRAQHVAGRQPAGAVVQVGHHRRHPEGPEAGARRPLQDLGGQPCPGHRAPQGDDGAT